MSDALALTLDPAAAIAALHDGNVAHAAAYPGDPTTRQPVHTVYGGANLFKVGVHRKLGQLALRALDTYAPDAATFAAALGLPADSAEDIYARVRDKLAREPIEDQRIDFEDGYGHRRDDEEDGHALSAAAELAAAMAANDLPPFIGIRIKPFTDESGRRGVRTLDLFLTALAGHTGGKVPANFVVTLPKVTHPGQVAVLADLLDQLETRLGIAPRAIGIDLMVETTQSILAPDGSVAVPALVRAGRGRVVSAAFGTYDYTATCNITAAFQTHDHPACDFARHMMQVSLAGSGVTMSDGATTVMPIGPHRAPKGGSLTPAQEAENRAVVHAAWKLHFDNIGHSLRHAVYQGWDLNPGQLPIRYAAVYAFFQAGLHDASLRLDKFVAAASQATLVGNTFDDAATGQGLLNYFLRGLGCGAIDEAQVTATGITVAELHGRSFARIVANRAHQKRDEG